MIAKNHLSLVRSNNKTTNEEGRLIIDKTKMYDYKKGGVKLDKLSKNKKNKTFIINKFYKKRVMLINVERERQMYSRSI